MKGEFKLIKNLTSLLNIKDNSVVVGFGDDCACVKISDELIIFTNDIQVQNKHFILEKISPIDLGWRLVSVNVSDIVSCGGVPKWGMISIGLPRFINEFWIEDVYKGINKALSFYKFDIIGGNTSSSEEVILDMFLVGKTDKFISRKEARCNDLLLISGYTGLSRAGLELILMNKDIYEDWEKDIIRYHIRPVARIDLQEKIQLFANSCIDISDGLVADLGHVSKMSGKKINIFSEKLPIHPLLQKYCKKYNKNPIDYILYGGEDYQLAFSIDRKFRNEFKNCFEIGIVEEGEGVFLDGKSVKMEGFEHL